MIGDFSNLASFGGTAIGGWYNVAYGQWSGVLGGENNEAGVDVTRGYDYSALLAQTPDAAKPASQNTSGYADPRHGMADQLRARLFARAVRPA